MQTYIFVYQCLRTMLNFVRQHSSTENNIIDFYALLL